MQIVPFLVHTGVVLVGAPLYTVIAHQVLARRDLASFEASATVRRRILKTSSQLELFLAYSFLLLGDKYATFAAVKASFGTVAAAAAFSVPVLAAYLLGACTRAFVELRVRRIDRRIGSQIRVHLLFLFLRMGAFVLATPVFFLPIYDLDLPPWHTHNLLGAACVTLFFFLYVLRGPNLIFAALGMFEPFPDRELESEVRAEARKRRIPVRGIRILRTWGSGFAGAFAHFGSSRIFVTDHLVHIVEREELKAILYHEVAHLGQLKASLFRLLGSYGVFVLFVYLKYVIDATSQRRIGFETLVPGFLAFAVLAVLARYVFDRAVREGEARADLFAAEIVGGRRPYQQAIAKVLRANGLSMRFAPSAEEVTQDATGIEEQIW